MSYVKKYLPHAGILVAGVVVGLVLAAKSATASSLGAKVAGFIPG